MNLRMNYYPAYLDFLSSVAVAAITPEGLLLKANRGFRQVTGLPDEALPQHDVSTLFINPAFADFARTISGDAVLYQGILTLGPQDGRCVSLGGSVLTRQDFLLLVAERDVEEIDRLNAAVLDLNQDLAEMQRQLVRKNRALERSEAQVRALTLTDPLSGLANRRSLSERLETEVERANRFGHALCLIMADIDHFKRINDIQGHQTGDDAIRLVAEKLREGVRRIDLAARFGGEEFVLILPECNLDDGIVLAERLRTQIAEGSTNVVPSGFTSSFGVTVWNPGEDPDSLLRRVDEALYKAKQTGRNRVVAVGLDQ